jgi:hypothetical protein
MVDASQSEEELPLLTYEVVRHRGHWRVLHIGKYSAPYLDQDAAKGSRHGVGKTGKATGRDVVVRLRHTDGKVVDLDPDCSD